MSPPLGVDSLHPACRTSTPMEKFSILFADFSERGKCLVVKVLCRGGGMDTATRLTDCGTIGGGTGHPLGEMRRNRSGARLDIRSGIGGTCGVPTRNPFA